MNAKQRHTVYANKELGKSNEIFQIKKMQNWYVCFKLIGIFYNMITKNVCYFIHIYVHHLFFY